MGADCSDLVSCPADVDGAARRAASRRYVDEHPGTLALDLDVLAGLIGWRENFSAVWMWPEPIARVGDASPARATRWCSRSWSQSMTETPDPGLEDTAREADATYIEVALLVDHEEEASTPPWHAAHQRDRGTAPDVARRSGQRFGRQDRATSGMSGRWCGTFGEARSAVREVAGRRALGPVRRRGPLLSFAAENPGRQAPNPSIQRRDGPPE
jgi:hypothetical protein